MSLTGPQIERLATTFDEQWDSTRLTLFASSLGVNLDNEVPPGRFKERALKFINLLNSNIPPRDIELLQQLSIDGNARLQAVANELLKPNFFSPTPDLHDAILLGRIAFVDRLDLRDKIKEFTTKHDAYTSRILIVRGNEPGGKSYSWEYLRHLAVGRGVIAKRLRLKDTLYTPRQFLKEFLYLCGFDEESLKGMPAQLDEPQLARIEPLLNWFDGLLSKIAQYHWIVIDDLNDPSVRPEIHDAAYALACRAEEAKGNLWIALLGFNSPRSDQELYYSVKDEARYPDVSFVADHFQCMSKFNPKPLTADEARQFAEFIFAQYPPKDKEGMRNLTLVIEKASEKLRKGEKP